MKRIGIVGGTFDPPHLGHVFMAIQLKEKHRLDHLLFIPAGQNPKKIGKKTASKKQRLKMLQIALKGVPDASIDCCELEREGPSYMIDTIEILKEKYPKARFFLLIGQDLEEEIASWKRADELLSQVTLLIAPRTDISSTEVRKRLKAHKYVGHLIDKAVLHYIQKEGIYV